MKEDDFNQPFVWNKLLRLCLMNTSGPISRKDIASYLGVSINHPGLHDMLRFFEDEGYFEIDKYGQNGKVYYLIDLKKLFNLFESTESSRLYKRFLRRRSWEVKPFALS